jgi:hypothetical protein
VVAALLLLGGCGADGPAAPAAPTPGMTTLPERQVDNGYEDTLREEQVRLKDGRTLTCIVYEGYKAGGLDCNWQEAR